MWLYELHNWAGLCAVYWLILCPQLIFTMRVPGRTFDDFRPSHHHNHHPNHHQTHHHHHHKAAAAVDPFALNRYETWPDSWQHQRPSSPDRSEMPPYLKKYTRRNRKLIAELEQRADTGERDGFVAKVRSRQRSGKASAFAAAGSKDIQWMQANLFEQQRKSSTDSANNGSMMGVMVFHPKELGISNEIPQMPERIAVVTSPAADTMQIRNSGSSIGSSKTRLNNFQFHRVATPKLIGAGSDGLMRKQTLPFVAITDRRLSVSAAAAR